MVPLSSGEPFNDTLPQTRILPSAPQPAAASSRASHVSQEPLCTTDSLLVHWEGRKAAEGERALKANLLLQDRPTMNLQLQDHSKPWTARNRCRTGVHRR